MKLAFLSAAFLAFLAPPSWLTNMNDAKQEAKQENKYMLVSFSGSDWCIPCIRMEKTLFSSPAFTQFASSNLVLVKADFPRLKKNQLPKGQLKQNEKVAEQYNPKGIFPCTLLLDKDGKVVKGWDGLISATPENFVTDLKSLMHASN